MITASQRNLTQPSQLDVRFPAKQNHSGKKITYHKKEKISSRNSQINLKIFQDFDELISALRGVISTLVSTKV